MAKESIRPHRGKGKVNVSKPPRKRAATDRRPGCGEEGCLEHGFIEAKNPFTDEAELHNACTIHPSRWRLFDTKPRPREQNEPTVIWFLIGVFSGILAAIIIHRLIG